MEYNDSTIFKGSIKTDIRQGSSSNLTAVNRRNRALVDWDIMIEALWNKLVANDKKGVLMK